MNPRKRDHATTTPQPTEPPGRRQDNESDPDGPSSGWQSACTLFVLVHFFCVFLALSSNYRPSPLQRRLSRILAPYTQSLNLDLNFTPYHLTHATDQDVDHALQYAVSREASSNGGGDEDASDLDWRDVARGWRSGERRKRYQRLAGVLAYFREDGAVSSRIGQAVAGGMARHDQTPLTKIRCRKHFLLPWDRYGDLTNGDPDASQYFQTIYSANVLVGDNGEVDVVKIEAPKEVARPRLRGSDKP